ncbi:MAG TPA: hypothetical protein VKV80_17990 [Streptosporangiaceae bacterium]|nr:hypothetical protein [Streptosporangiaceae bacterium]
MTTAISTRYPLTPVTTAWRISAGQPLRALTRGCAVMRGKNLGGPLSTDLPRSWRPRPGPDLAFARCWRRRAMARLTMTAR